MDYPVVILGAGPAGARAAELLARAGVRVLVLEQDAAGREKVCGGLLNRQGQAALGEEVPASVRRAPFTPKLEYIDLDNRIRLRYDPGYWNLHRGRFDAWLRQRAVAAGATLHCGVRALALSMSDAGARLETTVGAVTAASVIDATGWHGFARRALRGRSGNSVPKLAAVQGRLRCDLPPDTMWAVYNTALTPFYGWLIPQGGGEFLLGCGLAPRHKAAPAPGVRRAAWDVLQPYLRLLEARGAAYTLLDTKPRGCPITWIGNLGQVWWGMGRVFTVGEAAGLVSPSSGGGIHYALEHAAALAQALVDSGAVSAAGGVTATGPLDSRLVLARTQARLAPQLARLRLSCIKAWVAARPRLRALSTAILPAYTGARIERLPWV